MSQLDDTQRNELHDHLVCNSIFNDQLKPVLDDCKTNWSSGNFSLEAVQEAMSAHLKPNEVTDIFDTNQFLHRFVKELIILLCQREGSWTEKLDQAGGLFCMLIESFGSSRSTERVARQSELFTAISAACDDASKPEKKNMPKWNAPHEQILNHVEQK